MSRAENRRRSGLLVPLFACVSTRSWGIGDIGDVPAVAAWLSGAGQQALQLLPLNEMAPGQQSPYSAISAMAIDPIYLDLSAVPDFQALGGEPSLDAEDRQRLADVRTSERIDYASVRKLKQRASRAAFARFVAVEWRRDTARARAFRAFIADESWWLDDYALFRAIHAREDERAWMEWPEPLRRRDPAALADARTQLADGVLRTQYRQWQAAEQWGRVREAARTCHVALLGDLPFMVDGDSADVWAHQSSFMLDASVGVPPDAFSATGQDWGMPVYRWDALAADDFRWLRDRARRAAELYDGFRIDHLVGFYRTYGRRKSDNVPFFTPSEEHQQRALGERVLGVFREPGAEVVAEDLGTVPDFVRASLAHLGVPGFKVARWEREWHMPGQPFRDPVDYPVCSVANSGTHDTETMAVWWTQAPRDEREAFARMPTVARIARGVDIVDAPYNAAVRDILLESLFAAGSELLVLPVQDVFGWRDRINQPATVHEGNWSFKLPWPVDSLDAVPNARERRHMLRRWARDSGRAA
jgi:4-alpha-glucanotransferase